MQSGMEGLSLKQQSFSSLDQAHKKKRTKREVFFERDGCSGALATAGSPDSTALQQAAKGPTADAAPGNAANLFSSTVVWAFRSWGRGNTLRHAFHA